MHLRSEGILDMRSKYIRCKDIIVDNLGYLLLDILLADYELLSSL